MLSDIDKKIIFNIKPEINYAFQASVSFSQYSLYSSCNHKWYLSYGLNLAPWTSTIHTVFGSSLHVVIQEYLKKMYSEGGLAADEMDLIKMFNETFRAKYKEEYTKSKEHFSSADEMREFFEDAIAILEFFKKNRRKYFSIRKTKLLGIEIPIIYPVAKNIFIKGYIDFVLYDEETDKVIIFDIKSSKNAWSKSQRSDKVKLSQLLLYKHYFSKQFDFPIDNIDVKFIIFKRKIYENSSFAQPLIQTISPPSGKNKIETCLAEFNKFVEECFEEAKPISKNYSKNTKNCKWCVFANNKDLCDQSSS